MEFSNYPYEQQHANPAEAQGGKFKNSKTSKANGNTNKPVLCASCDRCRQRKTKCDGNRPCKSCVTRYVKKHKNVKVEDVDISEFDCVYSPAKRRGPVPGQSRKRDQALKQQVGFDEVKDMDVRCINVTHSNSNILQQQPQFTASLSNAGARNGASSMYFNSTSGSIDAAMLGSNVAPLQESSASLQAHMYAGIGNGPTSSQQGGLLHQYGQNKDHGYDHPNANIMNNLLEQECQNRVLQSQLLQQQKIAAMSGRSTGIGSDVSTLQHIGQQNQFIEASHGNKRHAAEYNGGNMEQRLNQLGMIHGGLSASKHCHLLLESSADGNLLRAYYQIGINSLIGLPPIPTNEDYIRNLGFSVSPDALPTFDLAALRASRFSEIALGALVSNRVTLAQEYSNATVMCLRRCVEEPVHQGCMFELARAYFQLGLFRSLRGDMVRYFKYRRVCLTHLTQLDKLEGTPVLLAAISLHDAWAYMMHNASEDELPKIDGMIPPLPQLDAPDISYKPSSIVRNPDNQMWIQGPPPIFLDNEAPRLSRTLDALACAIRSCCDQANERFSKMASALAPEQIQKDPPGNYATATARAVLSSKEELCSRNMVTSAAALLQQERTINTQKDLKGIDIIVEGMDVFLQGGDEDDSGGFTDSQIQGLLKISNTFIEYPFMLWNPGPTYHMMSNATIMTCHLLNGMHESKFRDPSGNLNEREAAMFSLFYDTFVAARKVLDGHRKKLPLQLRCHSIPKANLLAGKGQPFIDLSETIMCSCRGCQGFVLMGCSPCVAAERAQAAALKKELGEEAFVGSNEMITPAKGEYEAELDELNSEFDLDDDTLLGVLSQIINC